MAVTLVALIRGIKVGRAKRVAMADLRQLVAALGYRDVHTLLNSGNVVFTHSRGGTQSAATRLEEGLATQLGVAARVIVLTADELQVVVNENSILDRMSDPARMQVCFVQNPAILSTAKPLLGQDWQPEALALGSRAAYVWCRDGILESRVLPALGKALGDAATARNWSTVDKLLALTQSRA